MKEHVGVVYGLCEKYGMEPMMWSDMFFRLANKGVYFSANPKLDAEVISKIPERIGLVYWDYYHEDKDLGIDGDYLIKTITLPLATNGTSNISLTKCLEKTI